MSKIFHAFQDVERKFIHTMELEYDGPIQAQPINQGRWTLEVHVRIHPLYQTRNEMNDTDRKTCLDETLHLLEGTHFVFKKAYERPYESIYYVKPDWSYWKNQ